MQTNCLLHSRLNHCLAIVLSMLCPHVLCHMDMVSSTGATWLVISLGNAISQEKRSSVVFLGIQLGSTDITAHLYQKSGQKLVFSKFSKNE